MRKNFKSGKKAYSIIIRCLNNYVLRARYEKSSWMMNLLGGELVSFEYLCFPNSFMNLLIIHSNLHVTRILDSPSSMLASLKSPSLVTNPHTLEVGCLSLISLDLER